MLSLGTELDFALAIASANVGLPAGSPPPVRAATSTFLMSFANSLPRRASTTAFLCLVVAHFEWPLIAAPLTGATMPRRHVVLSCAPPLRFGARSRTALSDASFHDRLEQSMHTQVIRELGMERSSEQRPLSYGDDLTVATAEPLDLATGRLDPRSPDEHRLRRRAVGPVDVTFERVDLATKCV